MISKSADFWMPDLPAVAAALDIGLTHHFAEVEVSVVDCPDLRPLGVSAAGLGGSRLLIEFGGEPYAHNPKYRGTNVDMAALLHACEMPDASIIGAGMADTAVLAGNGGEMIANSVLGADNNNRVARVGAERECIVEPYPSQVCGPIANLFCCQGRPGPVIRAELKTRTGPQSSLPQMLRESLAPLTDGNGPVGLGGVFHILAGQVRSHVMPNYECIDFAYYDTEQEKVVGDFLQFYEHMGPDLLCFTTLWTGDPSGGELNLRPSGEHTHFHHRDDSRQQAGHYHGDVTPDSVHYVGYFSLAESIVRFGDIYQELGLTP